MCGIAGIIKNANLNELDIYKGYLLWINMAERGRTAHGCSVIDTSENVINYYKCGSENKEPKKSSENDEALQMLGKCVNSLSDPRIMFVHDRAASTFAGGTNNRENTQPLIVPFNDEDHISLMHNGTIHNMEDIYFKQTGKNPDPKLSDSYLAALLFQEEKYDWLANYIGAASLVWYNTATKKVYMWRGQSPDYQDDKLLSEERPLYYVTKKDRIEFASTIEALFNTDLDPDLDSILSLPANTLFSVNLENLELEEIVKLDRSKAHQKESYHHGSYGGYGGYGGYGSQNRYNPYQGMRRPTQNKPSLPKKVQPLDHNAYLKSQDLGGLFEAIPFCINYPDNYNDIISRLPVEAVYMTEFKSNLRDSKINLFAGLYYNNGGLMHSQFPVYSSLADYDNFPPIADNYLNIPYLVSNVTSNVLSFKFKKELVEEYFWKGLLCKDKESFLKLEYLVNNNKSTQVITALELSTYLKCPTFYGVIIDNNRVNFTVSDTYYKGMLLSSHFKNYIEIFPYTNINYNYQNRSLTNNYYNYCLATFLRGIFNGVFSMRNYEELISPINVAGLDNILYGKYSLSDLKSKIAEKMKSLDSSISIKDTKIKLHKIFLGNESTEK
jgi:hypothetical protein